MKSFLQKLQAAGLYWMSLWATPEREEAPHFQRFFLRLGILLIGYVFLDRILTGAATLPAESYQEPIIYLAFLKHIFSSQYLPLFLPVIFFLFYFYRRLGSPWAIFPLFKSLRLLIVLVSGTLAWFFSTYDYNLFLNQGHYFDRLLLLLFIPLIYWRPVFVLPFLTLLLPVIGQFDGLAGFSWAAYYLPIRILILFSTFFLLHILTRKFPAADFVFLTGCLIAAHYWVSGLGKLNWEWVQNDRIYFLLPATYANGWLAFLTPDAISSITQTLSSFNLPLKALTLVVEFGAVLFFLHRRVTRFFLGAWVVFHTGVFFVSGICFWMWGVLDIVLLILFLRKGAFSTLPVYSAPHFVASLILIAGGAFWCRPARLVWHDVPLSYTYRFEGHTESGRMYQLPPAFFAPYDYQFTLSRFSYLAPQPILPITWGATADAGIAHFLTEATSPEQVPAFEKTHGVIHYDEALKGSFDTFLKQYLQHWNNRLSKHTLLSYIKAPRLLWTFPEKFTADPPEPIRRVVVTQVTTFYHDNHYAEIRKIPVHQILIPY
jgi:hypothetical protein